MTYKPEIPTRTTAPHNTADTSAPFDRRSLLRTGGLAAAMLVLAEGVSGCSTGGERRADSWEPETIITKPSPSADSPVEETPTGEATDHTPGSEPLYGIDTSRIDDMRPYSSDKDYPEMARPLLLNPTDLARDGVAYVLYKTSRGHTQYSDMWTVEEPGFPDMRTACQDAGLLLGGYHFLETGNVVPQVEKFLEILDKTGGLKGVMPAVDFEEYPGGRRGDGQRFSPTPDDLAEFVRTFRAYSGGRDLISYSAKWFWGGEGRTSVGPQRSRNANQSCWDGKYPPEVYEGTHLWWCHLLRDNPFGTFNELGPRVSGPQDPLDPWRNPAAALAGFDYPAFRQFTFNGLIPPLYDGGYNEPRGVRKGIKDRRVLDFNVSFKPFDELLALAGLPPGALPHPQPISI